MSGLFIGDNDCDADEYSLPRRRAAAHQIRPRVHRRLRRIRPVSPPSPSKGLTSYIRSPCVGHQFVRFGEGLRMGGSPNRSYNRRLDALSRPLADREHVLFLCDGFTVRRRIPYLNRGIDWTLTSAGSLVALSAAIVHILGVGWFLGGRSLVALSASASERADWILLLILWASALTVAERVRSQLDRPRDAPYMTLQSAEKEVQRLQHLWSGNGVRTDGNSRVDTALLRAIAAHWAFGRIAASYSREATSGMTGRIYG